MARLFLTVAALGGFLAVALGAFGAHALRNTLDSYSLSVFEIAVRYQFYHAMALFGVGLLCGRQLVPTTTPRQTRWLAIAGGGFIAGMVVFSGSLYLLALTGQRWLGAVTPLGGLAFLVGWAALAAWALGSTAIHD